MEKTYLEHLMESDKEYHFRIKTIEPIDEDRMAKIEHILSKYELRDITAPERTIIQNHPLDFHDIQNAEVWMVDAVTGVPVSSYILQQELRANLKMPEKFVVVRSDNDPLELETQRLNAEDDMREKAEEKSLNRASLLDTDEVYPEDDLEDALKGEDMFGDNYNSKFLQTLAKVSADRKPETIDPKSGMFDWLESDVKEAPTTMTADDFNAEQESVKPVAWWDAGKYEADTETEKRLSPEGNFDDDAKVHHNRYEDEAGKDVELDSESNSVR